MDWQKLKYEWKTVAWAIVSIAIESWDLASSQLGYVDPLIPDDYRWITHVAIPVGFLVLRRWKSMSETN